MARKREIRGDEADIWLGVLLDAAFDPTSKTLNLARSAEIHNAKVREHGLAADKMLRLTARDGRCQLLDLAGDFTRYPEDFPVGRRASLLLAWADRWMQPVDWIRLQARVRKRRERMRQIEN